MSIPSYLIFPSKLQSDEEHQSDPKQTDGDKMRPNKWYTKMMVHFTVCVFMNVKMGAKVAKHELI